jgi:CubicO group peptidase (beta-lactamase class C family)
MNKNAIAQILDRAVTDGAAPGFSVAWLGPDNIVHGLVAGAHDLAGQHPMRDGSIFWIASLTKAITTAAALQLVERGLLQLNEPVGAHLPKLAEPKVLTGFDTEGNPLTRPARTAITLRHLLLHNSGLAYDFFNADVTRYSRATGAPVTRGAEPNIPLVFDPGEGWQYGIGPEWTGKLIERVTGRDLAKYFAEELLEPLGMADTSFALDEQLASRKVDFHRRKSDGGLEPMQFPLPAPPHFGMGGGGLYSTARDYLKFLAMILNDGKVNGRTVLSAQSIAAMRTEQIVGRDIGILKAANPALSNDADFFPGQDKGWSLGFLTNKDKGPHGRSAGSLAWGGLANCYYWADPTRHVAGVLMTQVLPFADKQILRVFAEFERSVYHALD